MKNSQIVKALNDIEELFKNRKALKQNNTPPERVPADINLKVIKNKKNLEAAYAVYDEVRIDIMSQISGINTENIASLTEAEREKLNSAEKELEQLLATENTVNLEMLTEADIQRSNLDIEETAALSFMLDLTETTAPQQSETAKME